MNRIKGFKNRVMEAIKAGDIEQVTKLLSGMRGKDLSNFLNSDAFLTDEELPLHLAALHGQTEICELLIKAGADVNIEDGFGQRPMDYAEYTRHQPTIRILEENEEKD